MSSNSPEARRREALVRIVRGVPPPRAPRGALEAELVAVLVLAVLLVLLLVGRV